MSVEHDLFKALVADALATIAPLEPFGHPSITFTDAERTLRREDAQRKFRKSVMRSLRFLALSEEP